MKKEKKKNKYPECSYERLVSLITTFVAEFSVLPASGRLELASMSSKDALKSSSFHHKELCKSASL